MFAGGGQKLQLRHCLVLLELENTGMKNVFGKRRVVVSNFLQKQFLGPRFV